MVFLGLRGTVTYFIPRQRLTKDILDGSSSLKPFLAFAGESISWRESRRFEEGLNTKVNFKAIYRI